VRESSQYSLSLLGLVWFGVFLPVGVDISIHDTYWPFRFASSAFGYYLGQPLCGCCCCIQVQSPRFLIFLSSQLKLHAPSFYYPFDFGAMSIDYAAVPGEPYLLHDSVLLNYAERSPTITLVTPNSDNVATGH
jgi:hypothetical protein